MWFSINVMPSVHLGVGCICVCVCECVQDVLYWLLNGLHSHLQFLFSSLIYNHLVRPVYSSPPFYHTNSHLQTHTHTFSIQFKSVISLSYVYKCIKCTHCVCSQKTSDSSQKNTHTVAVCQGSVIKCYQILCMWQTERKSERCGWVINHVQGWKRDCECVCAVNPLRCVCVQQYYSKSPLPLYDLMHIAKSINVTN